MNDDFKLKNIFDKYRENKNSHVYLVETNCIEQAVQDIKNLFIMINKFVENDVEQLILNNTLPTMYIIEPKLQEIVTEDIENLIAKLQQIPVITKENYFIISEAERLNKKSGNQMLKIIEEPETDMIGFFVCNSAENVMPTISSRTQLITLTYDIEKTFDDKLLENAKDYLNSVHSCDSIIFNKKYVDLYKDIKSFSNFIEAVIFQEKKYINSQKNSDIICKENQILKKLYEVLSKVNSNCNINLLMDKFVLEVSRLK